MRCPFCGGKGKTWHYTWDCHSAFEVRCWTCRGTGQITTSAVARVANTPVGGKISEEKT